ncbi:hypothetical protein B4119_4191 [Parageobacillus caldoxylosilyticus]|uniref:Uncharacterized protein n=1 Tax=Saccharococcus caldoxylosilyticus TaxID=81408 RepID=A0A150LHK9_9BACL|nr:hypothetical protein B4119_4191 [Parageobacillus caldoxylosilyticus]
MKNNNTVKQEKEVNGRDIILGVAGEWAVQFYVQYSVCHAYSFSISF